MPQRLKKKMSSYSHRGVRSSGGGTMPTFLSEIVRINKDDIFSYDHTLYYSNSLDYIRDNLPRMLEQEQATSGVYDLASFTFDTPIGTVTGFKFYIWYGYETEIDPETGNERHFNYSVEEAYVRLVGSDSYIPYNFSVNSGSLTGAFTLLELMNAIRFTDYHSSREPCVCSFADPMFDSFIVKFPLWYGSDSFVKSKPCLHENIDYSDVLNLNSSEELYCSWLTPCNQSYTSSLQHP